MILLGRAVTLHQLNNIILYFILQVDTLTITKQAAKGLMLDSLLATNTGSLLGSLLQ
jgi:hypothetical protein